MMLCGERITIVRRLFSDQDYEYNSASIQNRMLDENKTVNYEKHILLFRARSVAEISYIFVAFLNGLC